MASTDFQDHTVDVEKQDQKQANLITPSPPQVHDIYSDPSQDSGLRNHHLRNLRIFQDLVGIRTQPNILRPDLSAGEVQTLRHNNTLEGPHVPAGRPKRKIGKLLFNGSAYNGGYYTRAMDEELKARIGFTISSICINLIYIIQILTAATITGLASYEGHRVGLTILGAINTVLAGLMAYLKGQGLPNRLLKSRDQFNKVMEYVEYQERQFSHYAEMLPEKQKLMDPYKEADNVRDLYLAAKRDQAENYPDTYLNNNERQTMAQIAGQDRDGMRDAKEAEALMKGEKAIVVTGPSAT